MTLDEAIKHAEEVAEENQAIVDSCDYYGENMVKCEKCAKEHRQLAEWLKDYKRLLEEKTGRWIEDEEQHHVELCFHCSKCGFKAWGEYEMTKYCGGCGAKMIEEDKENSDADSN